MVMEKTKVYSKSCPECKKIISSLQEEQFNYNFEQHLEAHKRKEVENNVGKKD